MPGWSGNGSFSLSYPDFVSGTPIVSNQTDQNNADIVAGLNNTLTRDGQNSPSADLPMGTQKHTNVGNATGRANYAAAGQVQDGSFIWCGDATGTADAIVLTPSPAITAYADGQVFRFKATGTNTLTNPTVNISTVGAVTIKKTAGSALAVGDIVSGRWYELLRDDSAFNLRAWMVSPDVAEAALLASANIFTASQTIQSSDAGAAVAPTLTLDRFSASPADADIIGGILFNGRDESAGTDTYAQIQGEIVDATGATEDGRIGLLTKIAGTAAARAYVGAGIYTAGASGGDKGANSLNATSLYQAGVQVPMIFFQIVNFVVAEASGSTTFPDDDTAPASGEGTEIASQAITLTAAAHSVLVSGEVFISCSTGGADASIAVFRGTTNILSVGPTRFSAAGTTGIGIPVHCVDAPGSVGPHTYSIRVGLANSSAGTWAAGGTATARYGNTQNLNTVSLVEFA